MSTSEISLDADAIGAPIKVTATRIGLIGDDHNDEEDGSDLPQEVFEAFADVGLIIHLGHTGNYEGLARGVFDRLEKLAPVLAVRDFVTWADGTMSVTPAEAPRVDGVTRVIEAGGVSIGALHNPTRPPGPAIETPPGGLPQLKGVALDEVLPQKFGQPVDVVAYSGSHRPAVVFAQNVLFVNPGSPTYPKGPGWEPGQKVLGTVGVLEVDEGIATFELVELTRFARSA